MKIAEHDKRKRTFGKVLTNRRPTKRWMIGLSGKKNDRLSERKKGVAIRTPSRDKARLERFALKTGKRKLADAFRLAISPAERETESNFHGNVDASIKAHESARSAGLIISENIDKELVDILLEEAKGFLR